ncbi:MAG: PilW family protein [Steroidobacteraceae bacterium]
MRTHRQTGMSLVELMVAMTISLLVLLVMVNVYVNLSRTNDEMAKTNSMIENGRFAIQILENDLAHVGYWGGFVPHFDDLTVSTIPGDTPTATPDVCDPYANWIGDYKANVLGIPVQASDTLPSGAGCVSFDAKLANTDVVIVRHAETCVPGGANCDADVAGRVYMQTSQCAAEKNAGTAVSATSNTIVFASTADASNGAYAGVTLRIVSGTGMGQLRNVSAYNGTTKTATISTPWATIPDGTSVYAFEYALGTSAYPLHKRDCAGTGTPATLPLTAGTPAEKRRLISNVYYIANYTHPDRPNEAVPTLVRSQLDLSSGTPVQMKPVKLLDGVEALRVELGIDNLSKTGAAVDYTQAVDWVDATTKTQPKNRGDGAPDEFKRCTTAAPCSTADLSNVVAVKLYVLARSRDITAGYTDTKEYCLGEPAADGSCPAESKIAAANDNYKRHVFTTSVRLNNISGRRETPEP